MIGFAYKPASFHGDDQIKMPDRSRVFINPKERRKSASLLDGIWKELIKNGKMSLIYQLFPNESVEVGE